MDSKLLLAYISAGLALASYIPYFINIHRGKTKPHAFSWLIWSMLNLIGIGAQLAAGAGWLALWVLVINCFFNFFIGVIGLSQRAVKFGLFDYVSLSGALLAILLWMITSNPLAAIALLSLSDFVGVLPTVRKAYLRPYDENMTCFILGTTGFAIALFTLNSFTITTWLYPATIILSNVVLIATIVLRRSQIKPAIA